MNQNQYTFEVVRDIATLLVNLKPGEGICITARRHPEDTNSDCIDWESSKGEPYGMSERAHALSQAYYRKIVR